MRPRNLTTKIISPYRTKIPAKNVYSPPLPNESCGGRAASVKMNAELPRKVFVATVDEERPGLALTIVHATALKYIHLKLCVKREKRGDDLRIYAYHTVLHFFKFRRRHGTFIVWCDEVAASQTLVHPRRAGGLGNYWRNSKVGRDSD